MNPILILVIAAFLLLMMALHHNPAEEAKKKHEREMAGKDPLIAAIEEHNKDHGAMKNWFSGGGPGTNSLVPNLFNAGSGGNNNPQATRAPTYPSYMLNPYQQNPYQQNPYQQQNNPYQQNPAQSAPPAQQGYYPPAPLEPSQQPRSDAGSSSRDLWIPTLSASRVPLYLRSGQKVAFLNSNVYTYDANGKLIPMPDGKYSMFNGRVQIVVRGGKKVIY